MNAPGDVTFTTTMASPIGPLTLTTAGGYLTGLHMAEQAHAPMDRAHWVVDPSPFAAVMAQLEDYFVGRLTRFDVPLRLAGTPFQNQVWQGLCQVPFGETISYAELARRVGNAKACRAVGLANGRNPIAIIVPCHRVIAADGTLGGYGGGLDRKSWLLRHEAEVRGKQERL